MLEFGYEQLGRLWRRCGAVINSCRRAWQLEGWLDWCGRVSVSGLVYLERGQPDIWLSSNETQSLNFIASPELSFHTC